MFPVVVESLHFPPSVLSGTLTSPVFEFAMKIFEEGGESLLPLVIAIAFLQYHFIYSNVFLIASSNGTTE
jgi:hypothetical protein